MTSPFKKKKTYVNNWRRFRSKLEIKMCYRWELSERERSALKADAGKTFFFHSDCTDFHKSNRSAELYILHVKRFRPRAAKESPRLRSHGGKFHLL